VNDQSKHVHSVIVAIVALLGLVLVVGGGLVIMTSCTINQIMTHTEGTASDVVDSDPTTSPNVSPRISLPLGTIP
jgi:hypothetical protein